MDGKPSGPISITHWKDGSFLARMSQLSHNLQPAYVGFVATVSDAAILLEACMYGYLPRVFCRPPPISWGTFAQSGYIFIFEEQESRIRRWTDGIPWSPSRVMVGFMLYRELDEARSSRGNSRRLIPPSERASNSAARFGSKLYGSLTESYPFKPDGLMKKTVTVKLEGQCCRLVSYYRANDVRSGLLQLPSYDTGLQSVSPIEVVRQKLQGGYDIPCTAAGDFNYSPWSHGVAAAATCVSVIQSRAHNGNEHQQTCFSKTSWGSEAEWEATGTHRE